MKEGDREYRAEIERLRASGFVKVPEPFAPRTARLAAQIMGYPTAELNTEGGRLAFTTPEGYSVLEVLLTAAAVIRSDQGKGEPHNIRAMTFAQIAQTFIALPELFHEFSAAQRLGAKDADLWLILKDGLPTTPPPPTPIAQEEP